MSTVERRLNLLKLIKGTDCGAKPYTLLKACMYVICSALRCGAISARALRDTLVRTRTVYA